MVFVRMALETTLENAGSNLEQLGKLFLCARSDAALPDRNCLAGVFSLLRFGQLSCFILAPTSGDMNSEELLEFLIENGRSWVQDQRNRHRPTARTLTESEKAAFRPFFEPSILDIARVKRVPGIQNPGFYTELGAMGVASPLDFTAMQGITFVDTILVSEREHSPHEPLESLLFHELVHVVQYAILGLPAFIDRYVRDWAKAGQRYGRIPLERDAYALQERLEAQPQRVFSVETEVKGLLGLR